MTSLFSRVFAGESSTGPVDFQGKFWPGVDSESTRAAAHTESKVPK